MQAKVRWRLFSRRGRVLTRATIGSVRRYIITRRPYQILAPSIVKACIASSNKCNHHDNTNYAVIVFCSRSGS